MDYKNETIYFANTAQHCIQKYNTLDKRIERVAGSCGVSGDRIGDPNTMRLNSPESITYYRPNA